MGKPEWDDKKAKKNQAPAPAPAPATPPPAPDAISSAAPRAPAPAAPPSPAATPPAQPGGGSEKYNAYVAQMGKDGFPVDYETWNKTNGEGNFNPGAAPASVIAAANSTGLTGGRPQTPSEAQTPATAQAPANAPAAPPATEKAPAGPPPDETQQANSDTTAGVGDDTTQNEGEGNETDQQEGNEGQAEETPEEKAQRLIKESEEEARRRKEEHTFKKSLDKVLNINENTSTGTKFLKHLLHAVSAFGHGFVGRDDPLFQAAVADFRAKRDAEIASSAKKLEQDELVANIKRAYPWVNDSQAYQMIVDFGNAYTNQKAHDWAMEILAKQFNNELTAKEIDQNFQLLMQDKAFQNQTSLLGTAFQNTLAQMMAAANIDASMTSRVMIEMAKTAGAYDEATGKINETVLGDFTRKAGGDTISKRIADSIQGVLQAGTAAATRMVVP
jgi:hypothetical protein